MLKTRRVYDPPAPADGLRVLVMRLWPRGIRKGSIDLWLRELGADLRSLRAWKAGRLCWTEMKRRYRSGLERPEAAAQLDELRRLAHRKRVTILCACEDEARCHRGILKEILRRGNSRGGPNPSSG